MGPFANDIVLGRALGKALGMPLRVISSQASAYASRFPAEIVECEVGHERLSLLCKYEASTGGGDFEHRGGVGYERRVYQEIISRLPLSSVRFHGPSRCEQGSAWLALAYLCEGETLSRTADPEALTKAADWAGAMHRLCERRRPAFVRRYDTAYFLRWSRTVRTYDNILAAEPWLAEFLDYYDAHATSLASDPLTIVHGEFYPSNILLSGGRVYPIDWESAAIARGEVDLASLIEGWPAPSARAAIEAYKKRRWPGRPAPDDFDQSVLLAQAYFQLRWLSEYADVWRSKPLLMDRFRTLAAAMLSAKSASVDEFHNS